jgi:hypothetical protein
MEQYLKHHFYKHPSISAVLARNLADNYVKPDTSQLRALESTVQTLTSCLDKLANKSNTKDTPSDKQQKKPKDKNQREVS